MSIIEQFTLLVFAHSIGDLALQHPGIGDTKHERLSVLLGHSIIWAGCLCIALYLTGRYEYWKFIFLVIAHFWTDFHTSRTFKELGGWGTINSYDQFLHLIQMMIVFNR